MNCHELLRMLTSRSLEEAGNFDEELSKILENVRPHIPETDTSTNNRFIIDSHDSDDVRFQYLQTLVFVLKVLQKDEADEGLMSVSEFKTMKVATELLTSVGILPCLLPGIGVGMAKLCPRAAQLCKEQIGDLQKYKRLSFSASSLAEFYKDATLRPAILSQLGPLLAALLQLHYAPLMKPLEDKHKTENHFAMTLDLYKKLKEDQEQFGRTLDWMLKNCPQSMIIKELMVILGIKASPSWLRRNIREILVERLMQSNGVVSMISAVCDDTLDLGEHWSKLDTVARLIAVSQVGNPEEYYKAICPQILELLASKEIKHAATMANCCITALYDYNPEICITNIVNVICAPLLAQVQDDCEPKYPTNESDVERCIENLAKIFVTVEAKFKQLPCKLISKVALPIFTLYNNTKESPCGLKMKLKQLLLRLLCEEELRMPLFAAFLGHSLSESVGCYLTSNPGPTGGIEISGVEQYPTYEEFADTIMELVSGDEALSSDLFTYLLKVLSTLLKSDRSNTRENMLETEDDTLDRLRKVLSGVKLLSDLANTSVVQEAQAKKPDELFAFIKSLFKEYLEKTQEQINESDYELLYLSLMLVKLILGEKGASDWTPFNDFAKHIKEYSVLQSIPEQLGLLITEVASFIERKGRSESQNYQDLSVDHKSSNKFEKALKDLADPLLPVRAHGIITLTKLIEIKDPCAVARKVVILRLLEESLKHDDSFICLAAINGYCALATSYPDVVLQTLVQEFINRPQRVSNGSLTSETRMKLGEILVKTTRSLGEMATPHKNLLVIGFLCATKDLDPLVRASSLSCLGELCKVLGFRLGNIVIEVIYCISCIVKSDKVPECRRAAVLVATLLLKGLGKDTLTSLGKDLVELYRGLKQLRDNDEDPVLRLHAQLALEELDLIVRDFLFLTPTLEKSIYVLGPTF